MSLDAIKEVKRAEDAAQASRTETAAACKRILSEAEAEGRALLDNAVSEAAAQELQILQAAEVKAEAEAKTVLEKAEAKAYELEKSVQSGIGKAAGIIVERIVNAQ